MGSAFGDTGKRNGLEGQEIVYKTRTQIVVVASGSGDTGICLRGIMTSLKINFYIIPSTFCRILSRGVFSGFV